MTTRFMIIRKSNKTTESGALTGGDLLAALGQLSDSGWSAGGAPHSVGLKPSSRGARVLFSGGKTTVIDGPFTEGIVAGFTLIDAPSKAAAIERAKRWLADHGEEDVELEIREAGCPGGVAGVRPESSSGQADEKATWVRYAVILKTTHHTESGWVADEKVLSAMTRRNEEGVRSGVMLAGEGLKPSSSGARVRSLKGKPVVLDGPFAEAKELVAGFWLIQVRSRDEAIAWVNSYPYPLGPDGEGEVEIREVVDAPGAPDAGAA